MGKDLPSERPRKSGLGRTHDEVMAALPAERQARIKARAALLAAELHGHRRVLDAGNLADADRDFILKYGPRSEDD
jgi:hypothetical protein